MSNASSASIRTCKILRILTPILMAIVLIVSLCIPVNAPVEYSLLFFGDFYRGDTGFWAFLFSPFPAFLFSMIATTVVLISSFTGGKSVFGAVLWNGYFLLQLLIHVTDFSSHMTLNCSYEASMTFSVLYYCFLGVYGLLYVCTVVLHIFRAKQNRLDELCEHAATVTASNPESLDPAHSSNNLTSDAVDADTEAAALNAPEKQEDVSPDFTK